MKPVHFLLAFFIFFIHNTVANAASISLSPTSSTVLLGSLFNIDVLMDFSGSATTGGGIDIFFDQTKLDFKNFTFDAAFPTETSFTHTPDWLPNELDALAFGNFSGISGPAKIGTITFEATSVGIANLALAETDNIFWGGGFYGTENFLPIYVDFQGASIEVTPVPLPAAFWFLLSGLAIFCPGMMKRNSR